MFNRRLIASLAIVALAAGACGSGSASQTPAVPGGGGGNGGASNAPIVLPSMAAAGGGSCSVDITGVVTKSWKDSQDIGTLLISYWLSDSEKSVLQLADNEVTLILNCQGGDQGTVSFTLSNGTTTADFPEAPGQYKIAAGGVLSGADPGQIQAIISLKDSSIWRTAAGGTFTVTTFGNGKFAGTFQLDVQKMADNLTDVAGTATIKGSFDLGCTSNGCN